MKNYSFSLITVLSALIMISCSEIESLTSVNNSPYEVCPTYRQEFGKDIPDSAKGSTQRMFMRFGMTLSAVNKKETRIIAEYQDIVTGENKTMDVTKDVVIKDISDNLDVYRYEPAQDVCLIQVSVRGGEGVYSFTAAYMDAELEVKVVKKGSSFGIVYPATLTK